jgi:hypothetical protein
VKNEISSKLVKIMVLWNVAPCSLVDDIAGASGALVTTRQTIRRHNPKVKKDGKKKERSFVSKG